MSTQQRESIGLPVGQQRIAVLPGRSAPQIKNGDINPRWSDTIIWDAKKPGPRRIPHPPRIATELG